jgi:type I restriction enzyme S subunit
MIAANWRKCTLGDLLEIKHGFAFKGEFFSDEGERVLLTPGNFREDGGLKLKGEKEKFYSGEFPPEYILCRGDMVIAMTDLIQDAPILGSPAFIPEDERFLHNQRLGKVINLRTDEVVPKFLFYLLNTASVRGQIKGSASGATVRHTSPSRIYEVSVELPPLPTQERIADVLSAYDELIGNNQRRIRILEQFARVIYREWFVHFRYPGHVGHKRVDSPLGPIPSGWQVQPFGYIAEEMRRNVAKGMLDEPVPYVGLEHIPRRSLALDAWEMTTELGSNKLKFKKGEILFGKIRPYFHKVSVAPFDGLCSADAIVLRARRADHQSLVIAYASSDAFVAEASATANGAKMPRANWHVLERFPVVIPAGEILERFSRLFSDIIDEQQKLIFQCQNLSRTRELLLPRLLSGRLNLETH